MVIMLDPGHGGTDSGAAYFGYKEKELTRRMAFMVAGNLLGLVPEATIYFSRMHDEDAKLEWRTSKANELRVDLFISIHFNSNKGAGYEDFISPFAGKRTRIMRDAFHEVITPFLHKWALVDRGKKQRNFYVLRKTQMPAILAELLFLDNIAEVMMLSQQVFFNDYADTLARAIRAAWEAGK